MDTNNTQFNIDQYEKVLDETPSEVRNFLWSDTFTQMVTVLANYYSLSDENRNKLQNLIFDILIDYATEDDVKNGVAAFKLDYIKQQDLINYINDYFVTPIGTTVETTFETEKKDATESNLSLSPTSTQEAPSPADVLASLKSRLTTPTAIAPASRELPPGPPKPVATVPTTPTSIPQQQKRAGIDPYRELPN